VEAFLPALPSYLRQRVIVVRPADPRHAVPINPLRVARSGTAPVLEQAWRAVKVEHTTMQLLAAWGEAEQGVEGRPRLWKHTYLWLSTLAACGLAIPDVHHFFHPRSPVYRALARRAPDVISRLDLAALGEMKTADAEELIASAKTRFLAFLNNPLIVAQLLQMSGSPQPINGPQRRQPDDQCGPVLHRMNLAQLIRLDEHVLGHVLGIVN
jgi:hypothetical protein